METWNGQAAVAPPNSGVWQAPTEQEQRLYEAKTRGDWAAYFDVLAECELFMSMSRLQADGLDSGPPAQPFWSPVVGQWCEVVVTEGVLPAPSPDLVFILLSLDAVAKLWEDNTEWLAVNPGTPLEAYFPPNPALWKWHAGRGKGPNGNLGKLRTLRVGGVLQGPVAHGLGCGALMSVLNGSLWNAMGYHGGGYFAERQTLEDWWGVTDRQSWQKAQENLLNGRSVSGVWEFVLDVRRSLARQFGGQVDVALWRDAAERHLRAVAAESGEGASEAEIAGVKQLIGRITRYEARFRADGVLGANDQVRSVLAWDYGRAASMARWGVGARFCDIAEAEQAVIRTSRVSQVTYHSWKDFAAGYILGRCLHFDEEHFGNWYTEMLDAYRVLDSHPESPWLTLPWR
ncbi:Protein of unknown function [Streptomyces sp. WMMB 714]|uniref:DUF1266 domain-containing protein n=1 Tax=Streptomyces sp. WMMB 714 TaxID=1286822 RepID=UPI0005F84B7C|nr:DUF1266 domain-containing protein [Streptomyces sp. WMMB 714]SCK51357.1 Protein of unknown function [Streptomyces sp. WMMB 714]